MRNKICSFDIAGNLLLILPVKFDIYEENELNDCPKQTKAFLKYLLFYFGIQLFYLGFQNSYHQIIF